MEPDVDERAPESASLAYGRRGKEAVSIPLREG
jgi:hypothetical protein